MHEHPAEWLGSGAWFYPSVSVWSISVDFRVDPGAEMTASIQFKDIGIPSFSDRSRNQNVWRFSDQPEEEASHLKLNVGALTPDQLNENTNPGSPRHKSSNSSSMDSLKRRKTIER